MSIHCPPPAILTRACSIVTLWSSGFLQELVEVLFGQPEERALGEHGDRGVALGVRDQRLLAECVAALQLRELHRHAADVALDEALARLDNVVEVAGVALAYHHLPALDAPPAGSA